MKMFKLIFSPLIVLTVLLVVGCKNSSTTEPISNDPATDQGAIEQLTQEDSSFASFDTNFNDDSPFVLGKEGTVIYPIKIGRRIISKTRNFNIQITGDSAKATLTTNYVGKMIIAASLTPTTPGDTTAIDTVIQKDFSSTIQRNFLFKKIANTNRPKANWKLMAISLPEGGTNSQNVDILELNVLLPNSDTLIVNSPLDYYMKRGALWWREIPAIRLNQQVTMTVKVFSAYSDSDFVTLTYGADINGLHRAKKRFELISQSPSGNGFEKIYQQTFRAHQFLGYYHAIIDILPRQVLFDDQATVEFNSWGFPYIIR